MPGTTGKLNQWLFKGAGIIEKGTNANGSYVVFADGTQICMVITTGNRASHSWPKNFGAVLAYSISPLNGSAKRSAQFDAISATAYTPDTFRPDTLANTTDTCSVIAFGTPA